MTIVVGNKVNAFDYICFVLDTGMK